MVRAFVTSIHSFIASKVHGIMIFEIAMIILVVYYFSKDPSHVKDWEKQFIEQHERTGNQTVEHNFDSTNAALLIKLCKKKVRKKELMKSTPKEETHFVAFKRHKHPPFRVRMIRCKDKFSVIDAPGNHCAYVLLKGKRNKYVKGTMFYIKEKFCYHPPQSHHSALKGLESDQYQDNEYNHSGSESDQYQGNEYNHYQEREYQANRHPYEPIDDDYYPFPYDRRNTWNDYYPAYDTYERFQGHHMNPRAEYTHYNQRPQFNDEHHPRSNKYENRELKHVKSDPTSLMESHQQDVIKPSGAKMDHSSGGPQREEMKLPYNTEGHSQMHRPTYFEDMNRRYSYNMDHTSNHLPHNNTKTLPLNDKLYPSAPYYQPSKMDKPSKIVGYAGTVVPRKEYPSVTALAQATYSYKTNPPPLYYSRDNDWPPPYHGTKCTESRIPGRELSRNPYSNHYDLTHRDTHGPRSLAQHKPHQHEEVNSRSRKRSPPHRKLDFSDTVRQPDSNSYEKDRLRAPAKSHSSSLDDVNRTKMHRKASYEYKPNHAPRDNYRQPLHSANKDYSAFERQSLEDYRYNKSKKNELSSAAVNPYTLRDTHLGQRTSEKTPIIYDTRNIEEVLSHHPSVSTAPYHGPKSILEGSNPIIEPAGYDQRSYHSSLLGNPPSSKTKEELFDNHQPLFNENATVVNSGTSCDVCGNENVPPTDEGPPPYDDNHLFQDTFPLATQYNETVIPNPQGEKNLSSPPHSLAHQTPAKKTIFEEHREREEMSACDDWCSQQSSSTEYTKPPKRIIITNKNYPASNYSPNTKNRATKQVQETELYNEQQRRHSYQDTQMKKRVNYPIYGLKYQQESEDGLKQLNYYNGVVRLKEGPYSSPNRLEKLPSSYLLSHPAQQTLRPTEPEWKENPEDGVLNVGPFPTHLRDAKQTRSSRHSKHIPFYGQPRKTYPLNENWSSMMENSSLSSRDEGIESHFYAQQPIISQKSYMQPSGQFQKLNLSIRTERKDDAGSTSISSPNESLLNGHPSLPETDDYSRYGEKTGYLMQRSLNNLSNRSRYQASLDEDDLSKQRKDDVSWSGVEELEPIASKQKMAQSYRNYDFTKKKQGILRDELSDDSLPKRNSSTRYKVPRGNEEEIEIYDRRKIRSKYPVTGKKKILPRNQFDSDEEEEVLSPTLENMSSPESQNTEIQTDKLVRFSAKNKGTIAGSHSVRNKAMSIQSSTLDQLSTSGSLNGDIKRARSDYLLTKKKDTEVDNLSDKKGKKTVASNEPDRSSSSDTQGSLTSEIRAKSQSNIKVRKKIISNTLRNPSSPESQDNDMEMTRSTDFRTQVKEMELKSKVLQNKEKYISSLSDGENSHEDGDSDIKTIKSRYSATKDKETRPNNRVDHSEERRVQLESSTSDDASSPRSQRTTDRATVKNFKAKNKEVETGIRSGRIKEGSVHMHSPEDPGSPITIRRSTLEDAKNEKVKAKRRSNSKEEVQSSIPDDTSSAESQYSDMKATYLLTKT